MLTVLALINLAACGLIWAAAMFFFMRHDAPAGAQEHCRQIALVCIAVGAFAAFITGLKQALPPWWVLALRVGVAMFAAAHLQHAWHEWRSRA